MATKVIENVQSKKGYFRNDLEPLVTPPHGGKYFEKEVYECYSSDRRDVVITKLLNLLKESNVNPKLYESVLKGNEGNEEELRRIAEEFKIPVLRYVFEANRCKREFINMECIGQGGFGKVYRMRHRIDGQEYAVKKIPFSFLNYRHLEKVYCQIVREVKTLASTSHSGIVDYHSCWFEPYADDFDDEEVDDLGSRGQLGYDELQFPMDEDLPPKKSYYGEDERFDHSYEGDIFTPDSPTSFQEIPIKNFHEDLDFFNTAMNDGSGPKFESLSGSADSDDDEPAVIGFAKSPLQNSYFVNNYKPSKPKETSPETPLLDLLQYKEQGDYRMVLYIQMQLCSKYTLEDYLWTESRISGEIDESKVLSFYVQLLEALQHIHDKGLVHRDVKPANIFLFDENIVKLGDFGLSKFLTEQVIVSKPYLQKTNSYEILPRRSSGSFNTCNIGTYFYSAPEVQEGEDYNHKADIYSAGVILFELFHPFSTKSERVDILKDLKRGILPSDSTAKKYPAVMKLVKRCVSKDQDERPDVKEISNILMNIFGDDYPSVYPHKQQIEKERLIQKQQEEIEALKREIELLKKRNKTKKRRKKTTRLKTRPKRKTTKEGLEQQEEPEVIMMD